MVPNGAMSKYDDIQVEVTFPTQNAALWIEKAVVRFTAAGERVS